MRCLEIAIQTPTDSRPAINAGLYGAIIPAGWSLMLALRARGIGAA